MRRSARSSPAGARRVKGSGMNSGFGRAAPTTPPSSPALPSPRDEPAKNGLPLVLPPDAAETVRDLADGRVALDGLQDRRQEVLVAARGGLDAVHRRGPRPRVAALAQGAEALDLLLAHLLGHPQQLHRRLRRVRLIPVHPDDDGLARLD